MQRNWLYLFAKISTDLILINVAFCSAYLLRFQTVNVFALLQYFKFLGFVSMLWLIIFNLAGLYKLQVDCTTQVDKLFSVSFGIFSSAFFTYVSAVFLYREALYSKDIVIIASIIALILINLSRYLIWKAYQD